TSSTEWRWPAWRCAIRHDPVNASSVMGSPSSAESSATSAGHGIGGLYTCCFAGAMCGGQANNSCNFTDIQVILPMSESRGKVSGLMETNSETDTTESETTAPKGRFAELQQLVAAMASDFEKFYKDGNKAAGTRVRNSMQELKAFAQTVREEVLTL